MSHGTVVGPIKLTFLEVDVSWGCLEVEENRSRLVLDVDLILDLQTKQWIKFSL